MPVFEKQMFPRDMRQKFHQMKLRNLIENAKRQDFFKFGILSQKADTNVEIDTKRTGLFIVDHFKSI